MSHLEPISLIPAAKRNERVTRVLAVFSVVAALCHVPLACAVPLAGQIRFDRSGIKKPVILTPLGLGLLHLCHFACPSRGQSVDFGLVCPHRGRRTNLANLSVQPTLTTACKFCRHPPWRMSDVSTLDYELLSPGLSFAGVPAAHLLAATLNKGRPSRSWVSWCCFWYSCWCVASGSFWTPTAECLLRLGPITRMALSGASLTTPWCSHVTLRRHLP